MKVPTSLVMKQLLAIRTQLLAAVSAIDVLGELLDPKEEAPPIPPPAEGSVCPHDDVLPVPSMGHPMRRVCKKCQLVLED